MNLTAMFEFGSNLALYLGMVCVIAVLFFFIKRQITETETKISGIAEVVTGLSMEVAYLKSLLLKKGGGLSTDGINTIKLDETMIISDEEDENEKTLSGYEEDDEESDGDEEEDEDDEEEDDEEDDDEEEDDDTPQIEILEVNDIKEEPKTIKIELTTKIPDEPEDYNKYGVKKLKEMCLKKGISAEYNKIKKGDLVRLLEEWDNEAEPEAESEEEDEEEDEEVDTKVHLETVEIDE